MQFAIVRAVRMPEYILVNRMVALRAKNTAMLLKTVIAINKVLYHLIASEPFNA